MCVEVDLQENILSITAEDEYTLDELRLQFEQAISELKPSEKFSVLFDGTQSNCDNEIEQLKTRVPGLARWKDRITRVAVVVDTDLQYGQTRQYSVYAQAVGFDINPFRERKDAVAWVSK